MTYEALCDPAPAYLQLFFQRLPLHLVHFSVWPPLFFKITMLLLLQNLLKYSFPCLDSGMPSTPPFTCALSIQPSSTSLTVTLLAGLSLTYLLKIMSPLLLSHSIQNLFVIIVITFLIAY